MAYSSDKFKGNFMAAELSKTQTKRKGNTHVAANFPGRLKPLQTRDVCGGFTGIALIPHRKTFNDNYFKSRF
jgi:hypothetical protein